MCPTLSNPSNGRVDQQGNRPGDRATYVCNSGYELVGNTVRTCQNNGQWSGNKPICERLGIIYAKLKSSHECCTIINTFHSFMSYSV